MPLFQKSVVNKYLKNLNPKTLDEAYKQFLQFYGDTERMENIRLLKEENYQEGFLREIFVDILGYTINPDKSYNLTTEFKNLTDSKKADGAILLAEKAIGVIELKSTKTPDLESICDQAFNYKNNQPNCRFVITSNFEKLRLYIDNATDWEEFNLFQLDFESFLRFYLYLSRDSIFNGITTKLKDESKLHEEDITGKLYNNYSIFKQQLFNDLIKHNPQQNKLLLFHKSQKLLDRILFVLFAEDRGLLPPNAITKIVDQWKSLKDLDEEKSLYSRFVKLFHHLDKGYKYQEYELPSYNGGLFEEDTLLDSLIISNEVLHSNSLKLSSYDFNTEVDVNILGHIFENSITEIEKVKAAIEGEQSDKNRSRRKKEGIFYTPKYITKYIVDNTVGALCNEKKKELGIYAIENEIIENSRTSKGKLSKKAEALLKKLNDYRDYLISLKILDPACGSGAFLNQALEFLINEHELIDNYRRELEQDSLGLYDITKSILENNLYGVDINEEAVEIAKLSLWIRTAERGRKLSDLSSNIKCGNSLIDDPAVAGDKAFDWNKEFSEIMNNGGFDVIIGNPPYISNKKMHRENLQHFIKFWNQKYESSKAGNYDIYVLFVEQGLKLLRSNSYLSFILPNKFLIAKYSKVILKIIYDKFSFVEIVDYSNINVFEEASVYPIIVTIRNNSFKYKTVNRKTLIFENNRITFNTKQWDFIELKFMDSKGDHSAKIVEKIRSTRNTINHLIAFEPGINGFQFTNYSKCVTEGKKNEDSKKLIVTGNIDPYVILGVITRYKKVDYQDPYIHYDPKIISDGKWALFNKPKILVAGMTKRIEAYGDFLGAMAPAVSVYSLCADVSLLKGVLLILNSKLINWFFAHKFSDKHLAGGYISINNTLLKEIPFLNIPTNISNELNNRISSLHFDKFSKQNTFLSRIQSNFTIEKLSNKIKEFYNFDFKTFVSELKKKKVILSLKQQDEWEQYFNEYKSEINKLQQQINQTDNQIDQLVYELYNLTEEEIEIVEESIK